MNQYVATFHTHLSALRTWRALGELGVTARLAPVPRALSSSCGTSVKYEAAAPHISAMDRDMEAVYLYLDKAFTLLYENA
ncbi:MAG: DUF3343 domain-containing protein [Clostridiales bacterium]|jgi:hypothetical protein|nr:DUF3343 domain-containing protein [Clostridiales bacterium]